MHNMCGVLCSATCQRSQSRLRHYTTPHIPSFRNIASHTSSLFRTVQPNASVVIRELLLPVLFFSYKKIVSFSWMNCDLSLLSSRRQCLNFNKVFIMFRSEIVKYSTPIHSRVIYVLRIHDNPYMWSRLHTLLPTTIENK